MRPATGKHGRSSWPLVRRLLEKIKKDGECWIWIGAKNNKGYGLITYNGKNILAHRASYEEFVGKIPDGKTLDHLCRRRPCIRPKHLEPVTHRVNILRGVGVSAMNARKKECPKGHPYSGRNLFVGTTGKRFCRKCLRAHKRRYYSEGRHL